GIARAVTSAMTMTITDTVVGSAHYFSPEQARGGEIKACSDLYSLGIVLYEMLTGVVPFRGDSPISVALKHIQETPKRPGLINPEIPENVENIVMKAIAKDPADRFADADEMKKSIELALEGYFDNTGSDFDNGATKVIERVRLNDLSTDYEKAERQYLTANERAGILAWVKWFTGIFLFFLLSFIGLYVFYKNIMNVPIVEVPNITGLPYEEARLEALQVGLHLVPQNEGIYHPEVPENHIISQSPKAGERVRQTRKIMVTVSLGPPVLTVPDLRNMTVREAGVFLENQQLSIGDIEETYSAEVAQGYIISQNPLPEEEVEAGASIDIVVSLGPKPNMIAVPNVVGLYLEEAVAKIEEAGFRAGEIKRELTKRYMPDQVAEMEYQSGEMIPEGSEIDLIVSSGLINTEGAPIHKGVTMRFSVPAGNWNQNIEIVIIDNNGRDTIYRGTNHPGDYIQVSFNSVGQTWYEIYINGQLRYDGPLEE
ncbi:MAG: PASTA domain-containing protein, partial [Halanaerobiaceae bacterium]|nr:PASTA domain-containing protein [Halanaerobiaceae bacterium]